MNTHRQSVFLRNKVQPYFDRFLIWPTMELRQGKVKSFKRWTGISSCHVDTTTPHDLAPCSCCQVDSGHKHFCITDDGESSSEAVLCSMCASLISSGEVTKEEWNLAKDLEAKDERIDFSIKCEKRGVQVMYTHPDADDRCVEVTAVVDVDGNGDPLLVIEVRDGNTRLSISPSVTLADTAS